MPYKDFTKLLDDNEEYNVIVNKHKKAFAAYSTVLHSNVTAKWNENDIKIIAKPNVSSQIFEIILKRVMYIVYILYIFLFWLSNTHIPTIILDIYGGILNC